MAVVMRITDNPIADWNTYCDECEERMNSLPTCSECGERIDQDSAVCIDGKWYCDDCINDFRKFIGD